VKRYFALALTLAFPLGSLHAQQPPAAPPGPVIVLKERQAKVVPQRQGFNHTGGGNIDVAQPAPDTVVLTMTGVAVAGAHPFKNSVASQDFDLTQCFDVVLDKPENRKLRLVVTTRVIGLLRSHKHGGGTAEESGAVTVTSGPAALATLQAPAHSVCGGECLSVNDQEGPATLPIAPGPFTVHQVFHVAAHHGNNVAPCKAASAEFAPDPALDPLWISYWEPFHGAAKKDFGFQVVLKAVAD
jgi:hypothetical protein